MAMTVMDTTIGAKGLGLGRFPRGSGLLVYAAIGACLGVIGPFGSYLNDGGPATRILYWTATSSLGWVLFDLLVDRIVPPVARIPRWALTGIAVVVATLPFSVGIHALARLIWPHLVRIGWMEWYLQALFVSAVYLVARSLWPRVMPVMRVPAEPARLGREVLCLQMEDHYVRVHSRDGSRLVLNSLARAVAELKAVEGLQVHRSWWVARHAVDAIVEDGRNIRLRLTNGLEAPVSRTRIAMLRAAGWL